MKLKKSETVFMVDRQTAMRIEMLAFHLGIGAAQVIKRCVDALAKEKLIKKHKDMLACGCVVTKGYRCLVHSEP